MKNKGIGLVLIIFGIIFLANNLELIQVSVVELIRIYWPLILIWLGIDALIRGTKKTKD